MIEFLPALGLLIWGFVMGAAWQTAREQNRRARRMGPPRGNYGLPADHDWRRFR
ncbi:MAG: hypothetical protein ACO3GP_02800 [Candidatus Limnocylindrus sp.]